ncbi:hypothetical protein ACH4ND_30985 [Streptomyces sp. NPDC017179]|uniref:hypothetical protein n=1 Tax=Streptomyces sp. NPDC017179 TaxID=3364979 RepID=UPI003790BAC1
MEQVPGAKDKLALVLMAIYAVRPEQVALQLVKEWLIERHQRWPLSSNPYLIVSPITALHVDRPAVGPSNFKALRDRIGINPTQPRQDRFLDKARESADPSG